MKYSLYIFFLFIILCIVSCNIGSIPDKDLSLANIKSVELEFPKSSHQKENIKLDSSHIKLFAEIINDRENNNCVEPSNCFTVHIELKDGAGVYYLTDGINFHGFDDSSDLPFCFKTQTNILKTVFDLQTIDSCK
jgi:hypothetical protein